ncbi:MAG: DNA topoisomerase III [Firmicutes bacterium]|nr:DNA topoisomerase III [Bacillota bacterium]
MKTLVLAEKPSVGKDIARVLGCRGGKNGYIEGEKYIVTWALGHLVTLADPEEYEARYKTWDISHLPIIPEKQRLTVIPQTSKQYRTVKELLLRKDVATIVIATDAGREGELVARWIIEKAKCNKPIKRLWISSVTDKAIKDGFNNLQDGKNYQNLCDSAKARAEADWLVGINATRCLTTKYNGQLSCGRVQTPTLAMIAQREDDIRKFIPQPFYGISAFSTGSTGSTGSTNSSTNFNLTWYNNESSRVFDKEKVAATLAKLNGETVGTVINLTKTAKKKYPPKLYDLTELQRDASNRFSYSPKETLSIMQRLYEEHKVLTYPRTDSRYITTDIVPTIGERLKGCAAAPYAKICTQILRSPIRPNSNFVDNAKVTDHHAIIPTEHPVNLADLGDRERKIYDLVIMRFLAVFLQPYEYEQVSLTVKIGGEIFKASGSTVISQGFRTIYKFDDDDNEESESKQTLPSLKNGEKIPIKGIKMTDGKTSPPSYFNEATLLSAMESPAKYVQNKALAETLKQTGGLGTVATRADIIEKLFDNFMIEKRGKDIFTTSKGRQVINLAPKGLCSPELTGDWEQKLLKISKGNLKRADFIKDIKVYTAEIISEIKASEKIYKHDNLTTTKCPECGKFMLQVKGKKGEMLVCQDRECNSRISLSVDIRSKCPKCHKFLKIVGTGDKRMITCTCGHREKYATFEARKKEEKNSMSKRDVQNFIHEMNKKSDNTPNNNPFAALKGIKFN